MSEKPPVKLSGWDGHHETLHCPHCDGFNLHICRVGVLQGPKLDLVTRDEVIRFAHDNLAGKWRGTAITTQFWCENCDYVSKLSLRFHKGSVLADWHEIVHDPQTKLCGHEMWRD